MSDHVGGFGKAATAFDAPVAAACLAVPQTLDPGAERGHGRGRASDVVALQQAFDHGGAIGQRPKDERTVADGFVSGRVDDPSQRAGAPGGQSGRRHGVETRLRAWEILMRGLL